MRAHLRVSSLRLALPAASALLLAALPLSCKSGSHAAEGAGRGATTGVVSGAVGGLVGALVFGGNPAESAARGAVYGGATGATVGAIAGSQVDAQERKRREAGLAKLREDIGDPAYAGLEALVDCKHKECLRRADEARRSTNPNYAEQGELATARSMLPRVVEQDWNIESEAQAEERMQAALARLMEIRAEYGKPQQCRG
jgi:hypothetical protein